MGIELAFNFNLPYLAKNLPNFGGAGTFRFPRGSAIIFIPLGGNRRREIKTYHRYFL